ncbi:MAG: type II toxin-antitoxin system RelE family toxin [Bacillota bacterium]
MVSRIQALSDNPRPPGGEKLSGQERYRIRQGDYRILYEVDDARQAVTIVKIGHRREVYR